MKIFSPLLSDVLRAGTRDSRGTNVIPRELLLISSGLRLWTLGSAAFHNETENGDRGRELSGTDSLQKKKKKKLGQKIISAPLGKIKSSAGRERARGEMVSPGSHFIHRRVWNDFICCVDSH